MPPMSPRWLPLPLVLLASLSWRGPAEACSCASPRAHLLSTDRVPLNGQLVVRLPGRASGQLLVREALGGPAMEVTLQRYAAGTSDVVVVRPKTPWKAQHRYELVLESSNGRHPRYVVFASITVGTVEDEKAPKLDRPIRAVLRDEQVLKGTSCQSAERWIEVEGKPAEDEGEVFYAVWIAPASTRIAADAEPDVLVPAGDDGQLSIGARSMCDWFRPKLPTKVGRYQLQVAAVDGAGARSIRHRLLFSVK